MATSSSPRKNLSPLAPVFTVKLPTFTIIPSVVLIVIDNIRKNISMYQIDLRQILILLALVILQLVLYSIWGIYAIVGVPIMAIVLILVSMFLVEGFDLFADIPLSWSSAVIGLNCILVLAYHFMVRMEPVIRWLRIFFLLTLIFFCGCKNSCVLVLTYEQAFGNFGTSTSLRFSEEKPEVSFKVSNKE